MRKRAHKTKQPVSRQSILCEREISCDEDVLTNSSANSPLIDDESSGN